MVAHNPFTSMDDAVKSGTDIHSDRILEEVYNKRLSVGDTDVGVQLRENIEELEQLLEAYRSGTIPQADKL